MAGEAAVVASPVGQTVDVIRDGENGFLAAGGAEWEEKLSALIESAPLRQKLAAAGLETVRSSFTIGASFSILDGVLRRQLDGAR
jgi:glycosyltransferase involved in cell wall biosynthesis